LGMELAGHEAVGWCEIDKYAQRSYRAIYETEGGWFADDIQAVRPEELPEADCYTAGFPCQSFSIAGRRGGFEDTRGTLFFDILRLAKERRPQYILLENVRGLFSHDGGKTFATILNSLAELGYSCEWQMLNSKDFGVPQNRERVFIIGHSGRISGREVFPITRKSSKTIKQIGNIYKGTYGRDDPETGRVYSPEGIAPTINTMQGGDREPKIKVGERIRKLTPKECWRLQGFPDWAFERAEKVNSNSQLYLQAGNAVTVNVVYEIAKRLGKEEGNVE